MEMFRSFVLLYYFCSDNDEEITPVSVKQLVSNKIKSERIQAFKLKKRVQFYMGSFDVNEYVE